MHWESLRILPFAKVNYFWGGLEFGNLFRNKKQPLKFIRWYLRFLWYMLLVDLYAWTTEALSTGFWWLYCITGEGNAFSNFAYMVTEWVLLGNLYGIKNVCWMTNINQINSILGTDIWGFPMNLTIDSPCSTWHLRILISHLHWCRNHACLMVPLASQTASCLWSDVSQ